MQSCFLKTEGGIRDWKTRQGVGCGVWDVSNQGTKVFCIRKY
ncbi:hypothetical protein MC7420_5266 [Coleofasciculus chthonoplastes PCC 7420]|uniref:Uncharacterized protein n=1 Tax=Coleofasciculus chthonoplastes PCC 7420 TaxID=118168 RepID=B4W2L6_9CYAN|nr:hypothetical protein MC7420_5266 [Coleofasciculus chthonoplastes PCC 7420]